MIDQEDKIIHDWQEADILEELQDPDFLQALGQLRHGKGTDVILQTIEDTTDSQNRKKRKRERPLLLKDIQPNLVQHQALLR